MPNFSPGDSKRAKVTVPVSPDGIDAEMQLWLGELTAPAASSTRIPFVTTGIDQTVLLDIVMPTVLGSYNAHIGIYADGMFLQGYTARDKVNIVETFISVRNLPPGARAWLWQLRSADQRQTASYLVGRGDELYPAPQRVDVRGWFYPLSMWFAVFDSVTSMESFYDSWNPALALVLVQSATERDPVYAGYYKPLFIPSPGNWIMDCANFTVVNL